MIGAPTFRMGHVTLITPRPFRDGFSDELSTNIDEEVERTNVDVHIPVPYITGTSIGSSVLYRADGREQQTGTHTDRSTQRQLSHWSLTNSTLRNIPLAHRSHHGTLYISCHKVRPIYMYVWPATEFLLRPCGLTKLCLTSLQTGTHTDHATSAVSRPHLIPRDAAW